MARGPKVTLTGRLVKEFLAMGLTNQEIADRLIKHFLGARVNRTGLIQFIANCRYRQKHEPQATSDKKPVKETGDE